MAIFTPAIAFAVGSLQVTLSGTLGLADRIWIVVVLGAGLSVVALPIIGGTWVSHSRPPSATDPGSQENAW